MFHKSLVLSVLLRGAFCIQPEAPSPKAAPLRDLPWAQLNFLHTTDVHGWWGGHLQEASFSSDWGDYVSFAKHMREKADADGSDLLLIDTGDRVGELGCTKCMIYTLTLYFHLCRRQCNLRLLQTSRKVSHDFEMHVRSMLTSYTII
jgi:hypothetical protein